MKKIAIIFIALYFASVGSSSAQQFGGNVSFDYFYSTLRPYGEWIEIDYDVYVWRPTAVHYSWRPYTLGNWSYTSYGWYWDSYEPFGWATYHYGRWYYDDYYGWVWMPGYDWGPSWVEWRYNDNYIGWAPLPPYASFRIGFGIHFSMNWHSNYSYWNFVRYNHFCHHNMNHYLINAHDRRFVFNNTKYRTNYYSNNGRIYNGGVDRDYIERRSGSRINERELVSTTKLRNQLGRRDDNRIEVYQPSRTEVERSRKIDRIEATKANGRTSLRTDKVDASSRVKIESRDNNSTLKRDSFSRDIEKRSTPSTKGINERDTRTESSRKVIQNDSRSKTSSSSRSSVKSDKDKKESSLFMKSPTERKSYDSKTSTSSRSKESYSRKSITSSSSKYSRPSSSSSKSYSSSSKSRTTSRSTKSSSRSSSDKDKTSSRSRR